MTWLTLEGPNATKSITNPLEQLLLNWLLTSCYRWRHPWHWHIVLISVVWTVKLAIRILNNTLEISYFFLALCQVKLRYPIALPKHFHWTKVVDSFIFYLYFRSFCIAHICGIQQQRLWEIGILEWYIAELLSTTNHGRSCKMWRFTGHCNLNEIS